MKASLFCVVVVFCSLSGPNTTLAVDQQSTPFERTDMVLWFKAPAVNRTDSLALGNGRLGAVLHHGVSEELIQISEETLWTNRAMLAEDGARMKEQIPRLWKLLDDRHFEKANELVETYCFDDRPQLRVDLMADMRLTFPDHSHFDDYRRELDMRSAVARLSYTNRGARFIRESFISAVDQVMVIRVTCDMPGRISCNLALSRGVDDRKFITTTEKGVLIMRGPGGVPESGLLF
jgi:alpha-L-fucosidase 2